jgi:O-antigen ligase
MQNKSFPITNVNYWFPSDYHRGPSLLVWIAVISCFITVLIKLNVPTSISRWPEAITTLLFLYPLVKQWNRFKKSIWLKLWALAIICPFIFFGINYLQDPAAAVKYSDFEKLARIYLFIPIAWWLGGNRRTISIYLTLALIGLFYAVVKNPEFTNDIQKALQGARVHLSVQDLNWQHSALFFSISLIGCLSYLIQCLRTNERYKWLTITTISIASFLCMLGIIATQTRAAYLGLLICLLIVMVRYFINLIKRKSFSSRKKITFIISFLLGSIITISALKPIANNAIERATKESNVLTAVINRDWDNIPYNSFGIRINTWIQALEWIKEKPLIGYGGKVRKYIIPTSTKHSKYVMKHVRHFHNSFIELSLGYGIIGMILAILPFGLITINMKSNNDIYNHFTLYGSILFLIMNCFESYLFFWVGPFVLTILFIPTLKVLEPDK